MPRTKEPEEALTPARTDPYKEFVNEAAAPRKTTKEVLRPGSVKPIHLYDNRLRNITELGAPGGDRILFWDESAQEIQWLAPTNALAISGEAINVLYDGTTIGKNGSNQLYVIPAGIHHGGLLGLGDDDHPLYLLADGTRGLNGYFDLSEIAPPATPASGWGRLYVKVDGKIYLKNDAGTEYDLTATGSGAPGGADTNVQYNDGGTFGGDANLTWDKTGRILSISGAQRLAEIAAPGTPASGWGILYVKTDGLIYFKNDGGTEYDLTASGGGGSHTILSATHTDSLTATVVLGDLIHGNPTPAWARLAGNTAATKKFLTQTGTGAVSAVPAWDTIAVGDLPSLTNLVLSGYLEIAEIAPPSTPASGWGRIYAKTDGKVYFLNDAGTEYDLTTSAGGGLGYTIHIVALATNPADSTTQYLGMLAAVPSQTAGRNKVHIRVAGTITVANIYSYAGATAGTGENISLSVRLNNTTDYLIETVGSATAERVFSNSSLSIAVVAGDYIEIKCVYPAWATNPTALVYGGYIYVQ